MDATVVKSRPPLLARRSWKAEFEREDPHGFLPSDFSATWKFHGDSMEKIHGDPIPPNGAMGINLAWAVEFWETAT